MKYPLEAADEFGLEGLPDRTRLLQWLDSWLADADTSHCTLTKLPAFDPDVYTIPRT